MSPLLINQQALGFHSAIPLGKLAFVRHGRTLYTEAFPDLTSDGEREARQAIRFICEHVKGHTLKFVTSPSPRAQGTTAIMMSEICHPAGFKVDPRIREAVIFDESEMRKRLDRLIQFGPDQLSIMYETDPVCEEGILVESRSSVQARFYGYVECALKYDFLPEGGQARDHCVVNTSHYEDLYHLVKSIFKLDYKFDKPLQYGEVIIITVFKTNIPDVFGFRAEFRGKTRFVYFDCKTKKIIESN